MSNPLPFQARTVRSLLMLLAAALVLRFGMVLVLRDNLTDDRDVYLALARGLRELRGYSVPGSEQPTAFRPPVYPMILAVATGISETAGVAALNILLGIGTVALTFGLALRLGLPRRCALIAGGIIAVDPLLLLYTTFPMTETFCAFLSAAMLVSVCPKPETVGWTSVGRCVGIGVIFGLCVLSRPTYWVFGGLAAIWYLIGRRQERRADSTDSRPWKPAGAMLAAALLVASAWPIRNALVLGRPVLTTTHGGYTLLLGNNPAFYEEVVRQPWGTVWDGSRGAGQGVWVEGINNEMDQAGLAGEVAHDHWMAARARDNIREQPGAFISACLLRLVRFWNIVPSGPAADRLPGVLVWFVGCCYVLLFAAAVWGCVAALRDRGRDWMLSILLIVSFTLVHLVYWSNARMRAPVMPAVAVLAAAGVSRFRLLKRVADSES